MSCPSASSGRTTSWRLQARQCSTSTPRCSKRLRKKQPGRQAGTCDGGQPVMLSRACGFSLVQPPLIPVPFPLLGDVACGRVVRGRVLHGDDAEVVKEVGASNRDAGSVTTSGATCMSHG
eukprot:TRINITY_DN65319_c0_g1_i1.p2 TRINITY_DN65319_c0_g1~~TRINITY_DN65319_c0_g1_i1.p2  ORF type:complete len:120 (+),score=11.77 TRINITY_DN65319_c0_g1_i1:167-526(+)